MEVVGAIQTVYAIVKGIYVLQKKVVKFKEEVDEFVNFIKTVERQLSREESVLRSYQEGQRMLPKDVADLLRNLQIYLIASRDLLQKLTFYSSITDAPDQMRKLRQEIEGVKLNMVFEMVLGAGSQSRVHQEAWSSQATHKAPARNVVQPNLAPMYQDPEVDKVNKLMELGFDRESATEALSLCDDNMEQAATYLFELGLGGKAQQVSDPTTSHQHLQRTQSTYPRDHDEIGWEAYKEVHSEHSQIS
ncbi:hypothetical protein R1flu_013730 [Riccia fluitans]|uniref:UBA domain-containing protein n=1 Tax=Riccia fluitans TaxID=41844 RepID=A0ABD1YE25_9MARC